MKKNSLDKYEKEILQSYERGEWKPVKNIKSEAKRYASYAKSTLKKDQRISIRISKNDLVGIQMKAADEGIPYQTLITSLIHKYANGKLKPV